MFRIFARAFILDRTDRLEGSFKHFVASFICQRIPSTVKRVKAQSLSMPACVESAEYSTEIEYL